MITHPHVKINLGLNVLRRREDGYHDLETLFVPVHSLHDTLEIVTGDDFSRTSASLQERYPASCLAQGVSPDGKVLVTIARREGVDWDPLKDLTVKAYRILSEGRDLPSVKIFLEKGTPVGAGLGGGSADAAFALSMMDRLFSLGLSREELAGKAARLGSDCAFFLHEEPLFGSGRGEVLEPFPVDLSGFRIGVTVPEGIAVSTADAYRGIVPHLPEKPLREVLRQDPETWKEDLKNDFEETVFEKYPELAKIKAQIYLRGALYCAMSGSGSSLYALFRP